MLGGLISIFAGASIKKLWPHGMLFLLFWPALALAIQIPSKRQALATLGETLVITPTFLVQAYALNVLTSGFFFFAAFGVKKLVERRKNKNAPN